MIKLLPPRLKLIRYHAFTRLVLMMLLASLAGCASLTNSPQPVANPTLSWAQRQQQLQQLQQWQLQGSVGIKTAQQGGSAFVTWQQQADQYTLRLFGPLGADAILLQGNQQQAQLQDSRGRIYTAANAEQLLQRYSGWQLPVSNLYYWIRGLPVPTLSANIALDRSGKPVNIKQQGWEIDYLNYETQSGIDLPKKLIITNPQLSIRIAINQWQLK